MLLPLVACGGASAHRQTASDTYTVYRPANLGTGTPAPLVIACCGPLARSSTGLDQQADRSGFVVAYLSPSKLYNDAARMRGPGPAFPDIAWLATVINRVTKDQNIDPARTFMTGGSAGAVFSYRAACDLSDRIAAIGSVAGVDVVPACRPARPISVLEVHGTSDTAVPYNGTSIIQSTPATVAKWRGVDGCPATGASKTVGIVTDQVWSDCRARTGVELITLQGVQHSWPRLRQFDTTAEVWRFFAAHPMSPGVRLLQTRVLYGPRRILVRLSVNQSSNVALALLKSVRAVATTSRATSTGIATVTLRVSPELKPGLYSLRITIRALGKRSVLKRSIRLRR